MGRKRVLVALLATAALFGGTISGCNRNREPRMADAGKRRTRSQAQVQQHSRQLIEDTIGVRPAEVLSASAHRASAPRPAQRRYSRPPERQQQYQDQEYQARQYRQRGDGQFARAPQQAYPQSPRYQSPQAYQLQSGPAFASSGAAPVYNQAALPPPASQMYASPVPVSPLVSDPYVLVPSRTRPGAYEKVYDGRGAQPVVAHPSPGLTMARAQLQGSAPLSDRVVLPQESAAPVSLPMMTVPVPTPDAFPAPIPELEPTARYRRGAAPVAAVPAVQAVPAAPSAPAVQGVPPVRGWIPSPVTAMRGVN